MCLFRHTATGTTGKINRMPKQYVSMAITVLPSSVSRAEGGSCQDIIKRKNKSTVKNQNNKGFLKKVKVCFLYRTAQSALHVTAGRPVHSDTNTTQDDGTSQG